MREHLGQTIFTLPPFDATDWLPGDTNPDNLNNLAVQGKSELITKIRRAHQ